MLSNYSSAYGLIILSSLLLIMSSCQKAELVVDTPIKQNMMINGDINFCFSE
jgi:hypothetical protein